MRRLDALCWLALVATLVACEQEAPRPQTTGTTQALLSQPRAADLSTPIDSTRLEGGAVALDVDLLGVNMGSAEAPVKVIEFVDFGCGFCRQFQLETFPTLRAEFIETDMVEWKFMPFVSGMFANSAAVTLAAECALALDPRIFAAFSSRLWVEQSEWKRADDPAALAREWITGFGADGGTYDACLQNVDRQERVSSATSLASQLGVRSTPTFWIVGAGPVQGALPIDAFRQIFTQLHESMTEPAG
jgi:protein-disulfide isomerase